VLFNHPLQMGARWRLREVWRDANGLFYIKAGRRQVPAYRLYRDVGTDGRQRADGFMVDERV
jgi:hypothetical protein